MENNIPQNKKAIFWLSTGHFVNDIFTGILNPIMPFIAAKIGISMAIATIILTMSHIFSSLLQPIIGFFADNIHKRAFIFWGLIFSSVFIPLAVVSDNMLNLIIFIMIGSLGSSLFHPQALGLATQFMEGLDKSFQIAVFLTMGTIGYSLGPIVSGAITQIFGMDKIPFITFIGLFWAFIVFKFVPKISNIDKYQTHFKFKTAFKEILSNRKLNILNIIAMLKVMVHSACFILLPFLWKDMGHTPIYIGFALFMFIFAGAIGSLLSSRCEKLLGTKNIFYISMILTLPLMLCFVATYQRFPILSLFVFIITGFTTMLATPVTMLMAQNTLPKYKSIISGFINGFSWGIIAIVMSILGFVAEKFGITNVIITVSIIPAICSVLVNKLFRQDN